jgi:hypothetical protein
MDAPISIGDGLAHGDRSSLRELSLREWFWHRPQGAVTTSHGGSAMLSVYRRVTRNSVTEVTNMAGGARAGPSEFASTIFD